MQALEDAGRPTWFRLGDRDLAMCMLRTERLRAGERLTDAHAAVVSAMGVGARVLPMSDEPVRTFVRSEGRRRAFQEFMIVDRGAAPVDGVELDGVEEARPVPEALEAIAGSEAIVIGPSNPVISIAPILALAGMKEALRAAPAPVVAVSPFVGGRSVKGPTEAFCAHAGIERSAAGVAGAYREVLAGVVSDERVDAVPAVQTDTLMDTNEARRRVAATTLEFAGTL
jgi:LPPG:FO 2-phospho-L-lactate transferase